MKEKVNDIKAALEAHAYLSALALALTLPDICGQVMNHVTGGTRDTYIQWVKKYVIPVYFFNELLGDNFYVFDETICYALRCKFLHNGNLDVADNKWVLEKETSFDLVVGMEEKQDAGWRYKAKKDSPRNNDTCIRIDVKYLCESLCEAALSYYTSFPDKTAFTDRTVNIVNL